MEHFKRSLNDHLIDYDDRKRQKIQTTSNESSSSVICLEDLSNEVIYEIFEYLDYFHTYEAFFDLNSRFRQLLTHSNFPMHIDLSHVSKSIWDRRHSDVIEYNMHRIITLHSSNPCMDDLVLTSLEKMLPFDRLENLIIQNIEYQSLKTLLDQLVSLSRLSSLTLSTIDDVASRESIYHQIFRLPALKYCKISWSGWVEDGSISGCTDEFNSPVEHLIITTSIGVHELNALLSYLPQLRRLSLLLKRSWSFPNHRYIHVCNQLNRIDLEINNIQFDFLEQTFREIFPTKKLLHLTLDIKSDTDSTYLNANRWKPLITSFIPNLQTFDIQCDVSANNGVFSLDINREFSNPFWIKRKWSFTHHFYYERSKKHILLRSANHSRRKRCTLYDNQMLIDQEKLVFHSIREIDIYSEKSIINCPDSFPNATELHLNNGFNTCSTSLELSLARILCREQINKLVIECHHFSLKKMIDLLSYLPNIQSLIFESMPLYKDDLALLEQSKPFRSVSETNHIKHVTFHDQCDLDKVELLVDLCPRVQHLSIHTFDRTIKPAIRVLFDKTNPNTRYLSSLWFSEVSRTTTVRLRRLFQLGGLVDNCTVKVTNSCVYLWR